MKHYGSQIENKIFWVGLENCWEKESVKLWNKLCLNSKIIFDIGANTGIYGLLAETLNPAAKIYAFEPVDRIYDRLIENIELNKSKIVPIKQALSNNIGNAVIYDTQSDHIYSVTVNKNLHAEGTKVKETTISITTMNSFIQEHQIGNIDLIKIDVETHEPEVLEGYSEFLKQHQPSILIEILNDEVGLKVYDIVKDLNYLYFNIDERGSVRQVSEITKSDYYNYLLCKREVANYLELI